MESIPDSGVEIRNEDVAPLEAPDFLRVTAAGMTEQEHSGSGTPAKEAKKTDFRLLSPNLFLIRSTDKNERITPAITSPKSRYGAEKSMYCHKVSK